MTRSQRKALLEGGNVARRSYLWSAGKPKRYTAWESLGICPRPGTAQNIFLIITCMNRKFASYSCKWYQAGRDFKYFGGWAGTSKQSWRIREIAWEKKKKIGCNLVETKGKLAVCVRIAELQSTARAGSGAGEGRGGSASLPGREQFSSRSWKSSKRTGRDTEPSPAGHVEWWFRSARHREASAGERCPLGYGDLGRLRAGGGVREIVRSKKLEKKTHKGPQANLQTPKKPKDLELFSPEKTRFGQKLDQLFYKYLRWPFSFYSNISVEAKRSFCSSLTKK